MQLKRHSSTCDQAVDSTTAALQQTITHLTSYLSLPLSLPPSFSNEPTLASVLVAKATLLHPLNAKGTQRAYILAANTPNSTLHRSFTLAAAHTDVPWMK